MQSEASENHERRLERAAELRAVRGPVDSSADSSAQTAARIGHEAEPGAAVADVDAREKRRRISDERRAEYLIRDAMARGEFDNLKYAGKPIPGLGENTDPDWWIKGLIQREHLTGLGPAAILLRREDAELDSLLDSRYSENQVRETVEAFNKRVIEARRQLQGGPPVITKTRDVDREVERWRERRANTAAAQPVEPQPETRQSWWRRLWLGRS
jgi:hypothetical protein